MILGLPGLAFQQPGAPWLCSTGPALCGRPRGAASRWMGCDDPHPEGEVPGRGRISSYKCQGPLAVPTTRKGQPPPPETRPGGQMPPRDRARKAPSQQRCPSELRGRQNCLISAKGRREVTLLLRSASPATETTGHRDTGASHVLCPHPDVVWKTLVVTADRLCPWRRQERPAPLIIGEKPPRGDESLLPVELPVPHGSHWPCLVPAMSRRRDDPELEDDSRVHGTGWGGPETSLSQGCLSGRGFSWH